MSRDLTVLSALLKEPTTPITERNAERGAAMYTSHMPPPWRLFVLCCFFLTTPVWGQGAIEVPAEGAIVSGIGLISGWDCNAKKVGVRFDHQGPVWPIAHGNERGDTKAVCGDTANGFSITANWNLLSQGWHSLEIFVDGKVKGGGSFYVVNYGVPWLTGFEGEWTIYNWPVRGVHTVIAWNESKQNIEIVDILR